MLLHLAWRLYVQGVLALLVLTQAGYMAASNLQCWRSVHSMNTPRGMAPAWACLLLSCRGA